VTELETDSQKKQTAIGDLETGLAATDERARGADARAADAAGAAAKANETAVQSGQRADEANRAAAGARTEAESAKAAVSALDQRVAAMDNFELQSQEEVLFTFNSSTLSKDAKAQLEAAAAKVRDQKRFVVEVQGFTDPTGSAAYNKELSRKRADAVVQYLTMEHKIPLHRIYVHGAGEEALTGPDNTAEARKQSRRVEVRVYTSGVAQTTTASSISR
jgi:outer membrane protein OmpA-like peptidoglycan-associated protein